VPHGVRLAIGSDHRLHLPASFLAGAAFLVLAAYMLTYGTLADL